MAQNCCETTSWISSILNKILAAIGQMTQAISNSRVTVVEYPICDNGTQKIAKVTYKDGVQSGAIQYFDKAHNTIAAPTNFALVAFGDCGGSAVTPNSVLPQFLAVTASGTIAAGQFKISIQNVGNAAGQVLGQTLYVSEKVDFQAYLDEATKVFYRLAAITYDATNTEFHITVHP